LPGAVDEVEEVGRRAADGGHAEILHHHDLPVGVAARDGNDGGAEAFRAVVGAEAAGEQAIAVGVLDDVARVQAAGGEAAHHDLGPHRHVVLGVGHDDGLAGGAAGGVHAHDVPQRGGEEPEGVGVAQVGLGGEGQLGQVGERLDVCRRQFACLQALAEKLDALVGMADDALQPVELQLAQKRRGNEVGRAGWMVGGLGFGFCHDVNPGIVGKIEVACKRAEQDHVQALLVGQRGRSNAGDRESRFCCTLCQSIAGTDC
jgi:hypothetical protein